MCLVFLHLPSPTPGSKLDPAVAGGVGTQILAAREGTCLQVQAYGGFERSTKGLSLLWGPLSCFFPVPRGHRAGPLHSFEEGKVERGGRARHRPQQALSTTRCGLHIQIAGLSHLVCLDMTKWLAAG